MQRTELLDLFQTNIQAMSPTTSPAEIQESHNIYADLGLDSLQALEVVSKVIRQTQISVPLTAIAKVSTLEELLDLFQDQTEDPS